MAEQTSAIAGIGYVREHVLHQAGSDSQNEMIADMVMNKVKQHQ